MTGRLQSRTAKLSLLAAAVLLCPGLVRLARADNWFSDSAEYAATTKTVQGQVSVERDMRLLALDVGDKLKVQETVVTGKTGRAVFAISDGSTIEVFPNSKFIFRKTPGNWRDLLDVVLGRVRVQIEHIGDTPNPNKVRTPTAVISVRGTIFDIEVNEDDESTLVTVEEGIVDVGHALLGSDVKRTLHAGESIRVYRDTPVAQRFDKNNALRHVLRVAMEAVAVVARGPRGSLGGIGGGGGIGGVPGAGDSGGGGSTPTPGPPSVPLPPSSTLPGLP
jgi:ferric-dicitrate binding protein FerR (iron transport regulator)